MMEERTTSPSSFQVQELMWNCVAVENGGEEERRRTVWRRNIFWVCVIGLELASYDASSLEVKRPKVVAYLNTHYTHTKYYTLHIYK
jgi:hypothetical protein